MYSIVSDAFVVARYLKKCISNNTICQIDTYSYIQVIAINRAKSCDRRASLHSAIVNCVYNETAMIYHM